MARSREHGGPLPLFDAPGPDEATRSDQAARAYAIDPRNNVVLEASAGTGKTSVLVARYLALLDAGVDPANILAITFTRKAAAEMRERIVDELRRRAAASPSDLQRWRQLRDRLGDIGIGTIDAFCLALLGEFPLEANLDPGFGVADETDVATLLDAAVERALHVARAAAPRSEGLRLLLAQLPTPRLARALGHLVDRRVVATETLHRVLARQGGTESLEGALRAAAARVAAALQAAPGGVLAFVVDRPRDARFDLLHADIETVVRAASDPPTLRAALHHLRNHFVGQHGRPRVRPGGARKRDFPSPEAWTRHARAVAAAAPLVADVLATLDRDTNAALVRGLQRLHATAVDLYKRDLEDHDLVDFTEALARTVGLLANMDEFAQSRFRLQSRYHHVLVDEFQDTSRLQWRLVSLLVAAWGEGYGLVHEAPVPPTIFVVGDRKQSIYRFRDADPSILGEALPFVAGLRAGSQPRRAIARSFRARPELLAFINDLCGAIDTHGDRPDAFRYAADDRFPIDAPPPSAAPHEPGGALGLVVTDSEKGAALLAAQEIARVLASAEVRDRHTGLARPVRPGDVAVLFRTRESHRAFEQALEARRIPTYVYKGLGFYESDEIQDLTALIRFLARPTSPARTAAFLRSRLVRLSDRGLLALAGRLPAAVLDPVLPPGIGPLDEDDREVLGVARRAVGTWLDRVDRVPPVELIDDILAETAYEWELQGPRDTQARENVKKLRMLLRRLQNRGYLTMDRLAEHLQRLSAGDESNAIVDAADAVNLMTVHAAKGLEFPIVFLVGLGRGTGGGDVVRVVPDDAAGRGAVVMAGFRSDADRRERDAEREEAKRLLYVALTRARDRLYLSATVVNGRFRPGRGSLGEVLPRSFADFLVASSQAQGDAREVVWHVPGGGHRFTRYAPAPDAILLGHSQGAAEVSTPPLAPPAPQAPLRPRSDVMIVDATTWALWQSGGEPMGVDRRAGPRRELVGRLVHRLFQSRLPEAAGLEAVREAARRLLPTDEPALDAAASLERAASLFVALRSRTDVRNLLETSVVHHEVPFTLRLAAAGRWLNNMPRPVGAEIVFVRGAIDLLAFPEAGRGVILELKTGARAAWHDVQLAIYVAAATRLWPQAVIQGRLVYAQGETPA